LEDHRIDDRTNLSQIIEFPGRSRMEPDIQIRQASAVDMVVYPYRCVLLVYISCYRSSHSDNIYNLDNIYYSLR
jgi:hypothetical protein